MFPLKSDRYTIASHRKYVNHDGFTSAIFSLYSTLLFFFSPQETRLPHRWECNARSRKIDRVRNSKSGCTCSSKAPRHVQFQIVIVAIVVVIVVVVVTTIVIVYTELRKVYDSSWVFPIYSYVSLSSSLSKWALMCNPVRRIQRTSSSCKFLSYNRHLEKKLIDFHTYWIILSCDKRSISMMFYYIIQLYNFISFTSKDLLEMLPRDGFTDFISIIINIWDRHFVAHIVLREYRSNHIIFSILAILKILPIP